MRWLFAMVLGLSLGFFALNVANIARHGPYPTHTDEKFIADHAWRMVAAGDFNPHFFRYGSLPIYLTSACQGLAAWATQLRGNIADLDDVTSVSFPYYSEPSISLAPRWLFALLASVTMCAVAMIALALRARWEAVLVPLLALALNPLFQAHAWSYVNVDVLASALITCALAHLLSHCEATSFRTRALIPGLLCGAAIATKYNAGLALVPFVLANLWTPSAKGFVRTVQLGAIALLTFLALEPYAVLDWPQFSSDVRAEIEHYQTGHLRHEGEPGLAQLLFHLKEFRRGLGYGLTGLLLLGIGFGFWHDRKRTLLLLSFPTSALLFMSSQRVNFPRNLLPALCCLSAFTGIGLICLQHLLGRAFSWARARSSGQRLSPRSYLSLPRLIPLVLVLILVWWVPRARPKARLKLSPPDSRLELADWLIDQTPPRQCVLVAPSRLVLHPRTLTPHCRLETFDVDGAATPEAVAASLSTLRGGAHVYLALPRWKESGRAWNALPALLELPDPLLQVGYRPLVIEHRYDVDPRVDLYRFEALASRK